MECSKVGGTAPATPGSYSLTYTASDAMAMTEQKGDN